MPIFRIILLVVVATYTTAQIAEEEVQVGRYSSIQPLPTDSQSDIFETIEEIQFPDSVQTVGEAIHWVLSDHGFRLALPPDQESEVHQLVELSLPKSHRELGPMTVKFILETLAGPTWKLVQDPIQRLVSFEVCGHSNEEEEQE